MHHAVYPADGALHRGRTNELSGKTQSIYAGRNAYGSHACDPVALAAERDGMGVTIIFKIAAVGIIVTVLSQVLKHSGREEQAFLLSLAGLIIVLFWIVPYISELFETMETLFIM